MNLWYRSKATPAPGIALVSAQAPATTAAAIEELRRRSLAALADCTRPQDERVRGQLHRAFTAEQLWQARCEIYQAIARQHCEAEAARRLNGLLPAFEGLMPERALKRL
ncbi:MAG: hypothetical protein ACAH21_04010 [Ramlibacter sp.]|nr:hypothetical protein [Ramlibacter sp.]